MNKISPLQPMTKTRKMGTETISWWTGLLLAALVLSFCMPASAEEVTKEQIKGLDEQIQEIKSDVLTIAAELNHLEEKLLYPSGTQVAMFVSLAGEESFRLDAVEIRLDGAAVAYHLYSFKELEALRNGGVQRIYTGNLQSGNHEIELILTGVAKGSGMVKTSERFSFEKSVGPSAIEVVLAQPGSADEAIEFKEL